MVGKKTDPVVIVGGGLGGLTLARVLQVHGMHAVVYEREPAPDPRAQGGVLDMHQSSGLWALEQAGLEDAFRDKALVGGQDLRIINKGGEVLWDEKGPEGLAGRPEIDRPVLRTLLLQSLRPDTVRWGQKLTEVVPMDRGHRLTFANGESVQATLLVGADGARSRIRSLLTDASPVYCGVMFVETHISQASARFPDAAKIVGRGSMFALDDNKGVLSHLCGDGRIASYVAMRLAEDGLASIGVTPSNPAATRQALMSQFSDWPPTIKRLIAVCDDDFVLRAIHAMPLGVRWPSQQNITLLGDAAHLMSPFAGEGANLAMQDGAALALALVYQKTADAIAFCEAKMFERAESAARQSLAGLETCIAPDGAQRMTAMMQSFRPKTPPLDKVGNKAHNLRP